MLDYRIDMQVRNLIASTNDFDLMQGRVEPDEASVGGKGGRGAPGKTIVMGLAERGGRIEAEVIPNVKTATLNEVVNRKVAKASTDELVCMVYRTLTDTSTGK